MIEIPKGTKDILPQDAYKWHFIEDNARRIASLYNAKEIRTPVFEHTELFLRGVGESSDIVNKEMYTFLDKGERSITLKPEGTAGTVRSFIENGLFNNPQPTKMFYLSPIFRYEKPQAGRLREHHQFGIEMFGSPSPKADLEVIQIAKEMLSTLGLEQVVVKINSIGCSECRKKYNQALKEFIQPKLKTLCEDCNRRFLTNPLRILDCKVDKCKQNLKGAPKLSDYLCEDCKTHFNSLKTLLDDCDIKYQTDDNLVRGFDYYTKTVFELVAPVGNLGTSAVVCGGGRYNNLIEELGGPSVPAVGFGMGIERLILISEQIGKQIPNNHIVEVYIAKQQGLESNLDIKIAKLLREKNISCEVDLIDRSFKAQFKYANKLNAKYVIVIGEEEVKSNILTLKNMQDGSEQKVNIEELLKVLKANL